MKIKGLEPEAQGASRHHGETRRTLPRGLPALLAVAALVLAPSTASSGTAPGEAAPGPCGAAGCPVPGAGTVSSDDPSGQAVRPAPRAMALSSPATGPDPVPAPGGEVTVLTPESSVALALQGHPAIRSAESGVEEAAAQRHLARTGFMPRVDLTQDLVRSTNPVFAFGSKLGQERFTNADFALESLNQPDPLTNSATRLRLNMSVWDAGRTRAGSRAASLGVEAAELAGRRTREEVAFEAVRAYWGAVLAGEMREVAGAGERAAEEGFELASRHVEEGLVVPSDAMQAEVRLAETREGRIAAERQVEVALATLRQALGAPPEAAFHLAPPEDAPAAPPGDDETYVSQALAARPDLQALDRDIRRAAVGETVARSSWLPEVGFGAQLEWNARDIFGNDGDNWTVGASLRVPLFEGTETAARLRRARARTRGLEAARDHLAHGIRVQVIAALAGARSAEGRLAVTGDAVARAEESLRIVRERYAEGMAVVVELLDAEAAMTRARGNRTRAVHDLRVSLAGLDLAMGRLPGRAGEAGIQEEEAEGMAPEEDR